MKASGGAAGLQLATEPKSCNSERDLKKLPELHREKQHPGGLKRYKYRNGRHQSQENTAAVTGAHQLSVQGSNAPVPVAPAPVSPVWPAVPSRGQGLGGGTTTRPSRCPELRLLGKALKGRCLCWHQSWETCILAFIFEAWLPWIPQHGLTATGKSALISPCTQKSTCFSLQRVFP